MFSISEKATHPMSNFRRKGAPTRQIGRDEEERLDKKTFFIVCEGAKTEHGYFQRLKRIIEDDATANVSVKIAKTKNRTSPRDLLTNMRRSLKEYDSKGGRDIDEAWIVLDRDHWPIPQLKDVYKWAESTSNYNVAISDPQFEYWLILHYECGTKRDAKQKSTCETYLRNNYIPEYKKGRQLPPKIFICSSISDAIRRAKVRDSSKCKKWPRHDGCTTVYRLVESIIKTKLNHSG